MQSSWLLSLSLTRESINVASHLPFFARLFLQRLMFFIYRPLPRPTPIRACTADRQTIHSWLLLPSSSDLNNDTDRDQQRKHIYLSIADNSNLRLCVIKSPTRESHFKTLRLLPGLPSLCTVVRPTPRLGRVFCHAFFAPLLLSCYACSEPQSCSVNS